MEARGGFVDVSNSGEYLGALVGVTLYALRLRPSPQVVNRMSRPWAAGRHVRVVAYDSGTVDLRPVGESRKCVRKAYVRGTGMSVEVFRTKLVITYMSNSRTNGVSLALLGRIAWRSCVTIRPHPKTAAGQ